MGRKTTGLLNGSWVTEVISGVAIAHSFEGENGLFCYRHFPTRAVLQTILQLETAEEFQTPLSSIVVENLLFESQ